MFDFVALVASRRVLDLASTEVIGDPRPQFSETTSCSTRPTTMNHSYPCGGVNRRNFLAASAASLPLVSALPAVRRRRRDSGSCELEVDACGGGGRRLVEARGAGPLSGTGGRGQEPGDDPERRQEPRGHQDDARPRPQGADRGPRRGRRLAEVLRARRRGGDQGGAQRSAATRIRRSSWCSR